MTSNTAVVTPRPACHRKQVVLPPDLTGKFDRFRHNARYRSESAALVALIAYALDGLAAAEGDAT